MPPVLNPNTSRQSLQKGKPLESLDLGYKYPKGLNLRPGRKKHTEILELLLQYARDSHTATAARRNDWREIDRVLKTYTFLPPTGDKKKSRDSHGRKEDESRRIVMPVSSVILDTLLTYTTNAFLRPPIFNYEGTGPEDMLGALLLTEVVQQQTHRFAVPLSLHTSWRDMYAYGVGYASPRWHQELGRVTRLQSFGVLDRINALLREVGVRKIESDYEVLYEGNVLDNIDPYLAFPDPSVSAHEVQKGEFFGWLDETVLTVLERNEESEGMFNVRYLREMDTNLISSIRSNERETRGEYKFATNNPVDVLYMYVDLIPRDWEIGKSDDPETWMFAVAADNIIIKAGPLENTHGKIPVVGGAPDFDGYSATPLSRLMSVEELQMYVDFLYTSHVENIRRVINDNIVYDPSLINTHDLNDNRPGKLIRARKKAWGLGSLKDNAIFQLDVKDVTQGNVADAQFLMNQAKLATGTMDALAGGLPDRTSRISANEAQGTRLAGLSRLERPAQIISYQFMQPLARMFASNVQQYMSEETFVKATGDLARVLAKEYNIKAVRERVAVKPQDLVINYDVAVFDGAIPGKEDAQVWVELYGLLVQNPELAKGFNMQAIFKHIARNNGAPNVDLFIRDQEVEVRSDEDVLREVDKGNLVPSNGQE